MMETYSKSNTQTRLCSVIDGKYIDIYIPTIALYWWQYHRL